MATRLDTEWTADRKSYRLPDQNLTIAEMHLFEGGVRLRFYDDHHETASKRFASLDFPNIEAADYAVLLVASEH